MHMSQSFQSCKFAKWQWSKLSLQGVVLRGRLKWLRECKREHQRGREEQRIFLSLVRFCYGLFYIYTFPQDPSAPLYPDNTNRFDKWVWRQQSERSAAARRLVQFALCTMFKARENHCVEIRLFLFCTIVFNCMWLRVWNEHNIRNIKMKGQMMLHNLTSICV